MKILLLLSIFLIASCGGAFKYKKTDSRKVPVNVEDRVEKNTAEGRGFRLGDLGKKSNMDLVSLRPSFVKLTGMQL